MRERVYTGALLAITDAPLFLLFSALVQVGPDERLYIPRLIRYAVQFLNDVVFCPGHNFQTIDFTVEPVKSGLGRFLLFHDMCSFAGGGRVHRPPPPVISELLASVCIDLLQFLPKG